MKTNCTECGMLHDVGKTQKNAQMFCLGCDKFFRIGAEAKAPNENFDPEALVKGEVESLDQEENTSADKGLKTAFKGIFAKKKKEVEPELEPEPEYEADPPKIAEKFINTETRPFDIMDDFLQNDNTSEDEPVEYLDFMSTELDNKTDEEKI